MGLLMVSRIYLAVFRSMSGPCQTLAVQEGVAAAITVCCVRTSPSPRPLRRLPADHGAKEVAAPPAGHAAAGLAAHARAVNRSCQQGVELIAGDYC